MYIYVITILIYCMKGIHTICIYVCINKKVKCDFLGKKRKTN